MDDRANAGGPIEGLQAANEVPLLLLGRRPEQGLVEVAVMADLVARMRQAIVEQRFEAFRAGIWAQWAPEDTPLP